MKINQVGAELFHAGGLTERQDEANSRFSRLCEKYLIKSEMFVVWVHGGRFLPEDIRAIVTFSLTKL